MVWNIQKTFCILSLCLLQNSPVFSNTLSRSGQQNRDILFQYGAQVHPNFNLLSVNPKLSFIGTINGKHFYHENIAVSQTEARAACTTLGMQLAKFDNEEEFRFIGSKIPNDTKFGWTDATNYKHMEGIVWNQDCEWNLCTSLKYTKFPTSWIEEIGGVLIRNDTGDLLLLFRSTLIPHNYICYI